jgi:hypothetical protein
MQRDTKERRMAQQLNWITQDDMVMASAPNGELFMIVPAGGGFHELLLGAKKATEQVFDELEDAQTYAESLAAEMPSDQAIDRKVDAFFDALTIA